MYQGEGARSKADIQNPQHNYTKALIASRPSLDFRLKRLPTIQNFLDDTINAEVVTQEDRTRFHNNVQSDTHFGGH
jgi:peptide/nickel transport system ATP-binding protein